MAKSIKKVQRAIEIQGHVTVSVDGRPMQCRKIAVVDGEWVTDIVTSDLCGFVRVRKTQEALTAQAERIIADESAIRAQRAAESARAMAWMQRS